MITIIDTGNCEYSSTHPVRVTALELIKKQFGVNKGFVKTVKWDSLKQKTVLIKDYGFQEI